MNTESRSRKFGWLQIALKSAFVVVVFTGGYLAGAWSSRQEVMLLRKTVQKHEENAEIRRRFGTKKLEEAIDLYQEVMGQDETEALLKELKLKPKVSKEER